ncbi:MAG: lysylphosphatidylglycerol synthase transmembrane domain-containing protein [Armatimonadota bacterium]|nr:lysylphosphatidylglycerol synthase transmembrane domain-containing protein [Armatimonadota bacterium]MDR7451934.1 lysylphosphatidylglycerol synthase transmembrane domain-containing protein [Armatimonadota bacterium]MDR7466616.1 lysylphosphatidylglycerol synthase transmembrane domain-containing protein [Armatimonadota bacterium]MDR7492910.1 lysylphosphatidylglycerol synthase transmembrane domain-containing protein [Armatimonadota bacterium]MDR7500307.1 lysylphosphatidylglycerol synthase trans
MTRPVRSLFLLGGVVLLVVLLRKIDLPAARDAVRAASPAWFALAAALLVADVVIKAARWRWMVARAGGVQLDLGEAAAAILAGVAAASFSPARTVDLAKPMLLKQRFGTPLATSVAAALVERAFDGMALIVLFGISLPLVGWGGTTFRPAAVAAGFLLTAGALALASPPTLRAVALGLIRRLPVSVGLRNGSERVTEAFTGGLALWRTRANLWPLAGLSVLAGLTEAARTAAVFRAVGLPLSPGGAMLAFSTANIVAVAVLIPGGIGITELSMAAVAGLMLRLPATHHLIAGAVLLDRVLSYYLVVAVGALILVLAGRPASAEAGPGAGH